MRFNNNKYNKSFSQDCIKKGRYLGIQSFSEKKQAADTWVKTVLA